MKREDKIEEYKILKELRMRNGRKNLCDFTFHTLSSFDPVEFHRRYYQVLTDFADGKIKKAMIFVPPQHGKALRVDEPILTTKGWRKHGDLKRGDYVFGQDGKPKMVLHNFGSYEWDVVKVEFNDGNTIECAKEHLWKIKSDHDDHKGRVEETIETQHIFSRRHRRAPYIDISPALEMPSKELPIDPYILGCWLGDGHSRQGVLTIGSEDIEHFKQLGESREVKKGIYRVLIDGLSRQLRINSLILNKHIPEAYLTASKEQRLALLQGLMDTDGTCDRRGNCEFTQKSEALAQDVYELLRTLGIKARMNEYNATLNGKNVGRKFRICFNPDRSDIIFRLQRKQDRLTNKTKSDRGDKKKFFIKQIHEANRTIVNCIQVEGGMYLAGRDMIPTHNSEGSTRRLPAFILGRDPNARIAVVSYSAPKARKFCREIQRVIDTPEYKELFPNTTLNSSNVTTISGSWLRNAEECEIVGYRGGFKCVGVGGPLTGDPVDVLIMDDIYKDAKTAWSPVVRESVRDWYDTVAETRLHNNSQQLIVFTRWHEDDLGGTLLKQQGEWSEDNPDGWVVIKYPAIKEGAPTEWDSREDGEPLWEARHSLRKLQSIRKRSPFVFQSLYQQNPQPHEGLLYNEGFRTYEKVPYSQKNVVKAYIDTADTGSDYLCCIVYVESEDGNYILDVLYTQKDMSYTQVAVAEMLTKYNVKQAIFESNNGGRIFSENVEKQMRAMKNYKTQVSWFFQSLNKATRIFSHSADVQNLCFFPVGWERNMYDFYTAITTYTKIAKNEHDDAPDALTGTIEKRGGYNPDMLNRLAQDAV